MNKSCTPPRVAVWLLRRFSLLQHRETALNDLREIFDNMAGQESEACARRWFWGQVFKSIPHHMSILINWRLTMGITYFRIAFRNFRKHKAHSFLNVTGLTLGITCCLLIALWILDEMSFDAFHAGADRIYQTLTHGSRPNNTATPIPFGPAFKAEYPDVEYCSRYNPYPEKLFQYGEHRFYERRIRVVDEDFLKIFSFPMLRGDKSSCLNSPHAMVISRDLASRYFADQDPMGKTVILDEKSYTITGVVAVPKNSTVSFSLLLSFENWKINARASGNDPENWGWWSPRIFLKLKKNVNFQAFEKKIEHFLTSKNRDETATLTLLPFLRRHDFFWNRNRYVAIYAGVAVMVLLMACINFVNLSTARAGGRTKEVGVRKVSGAQRSDLMAQFFGESFFMVFSAMILALLAVLFTLPLFNSMTGKQLVFRNLLDPVFLTLFIVLMLLTGLASGLYPALLLSSFKPAAVLK